MLMFQFISCINRELKSLLINAWLSSSKATYSRGRRSKDLQKMSMYKMRANSGTATVVVTFWEQNISH